MTHVSLAGIGIRFLLGGLATVAAAIVAKRAGGPIGGIFAAFPAVFMAALMTIHLDYSGSELIKKSIALSQGALIGMTLNIGCALAARYLCAVKGWQKGLSLAVSGWLVVSLLVSYMLFLL